MHFCEANQFFLLYPTPINRGIQEERIALPSIYLVIQIFLDNLNLLHLSPNDFEEIQNQISFIIELLLLFLEKIYLIFLRIAPHYIKKKKIRVIFEFQPSKTHLFRPLTASTAFSDQPRKNSFAKTHLEPRKRPFHLSFQNLVLASFPTLEIRIIEKILASFPTLEIRIIEKILKPYLVPGWGDLSRPNNAKTFDILDLTPFRAFDVFG
ncbi:hypothetical protein ACJX0J_037269, partial [Zea mays]